MDKTEFLREYIKGYEKLADTIREASEEMLYYKPAENKWSSVEVIIHIADAECNGSIRFRKAIAESGSKVDLYDHNAWVRLLDYQNRDIAASLALFKLTRENNYQLLSSLPEDVWNNFVIHPEYGKITLLDILRIYTEHLETHIRQLKRNFDSYTNQ